MVFPEDDEWRTPPRPQSYTPEYSLSGSPTPESVRSGKRESPFQKWGSPLGTLDSLEFHSGEDPEILLQTIEEGDESNDSPLNSVSWMDESHLGWKKVTTVMDSGAWDSVAPPSVAPKVAIEESPKSRRGSCYVTASAGRLPNMGQKALNAWTSEWKDVNVLYQIAEVSRPLTSVSATCDKGNVVVYTSQGGFIQNCEAGERTHFERNGGIYELDLWMRDEDNPGSSQPPSVHRQGY